MLLETGCEIDRGDDEKKVPLHITAEKRPFGVRLILVNAATDALNASDEKGRSSIHLSAMNGHK